MKNILGNPAQPFFFENLRVITQPGKKIVTLFSNKTHLIKERRFARTKYFSFQAFRKNICEFSVGPYFAIKKNAHLRNELLRSTLRPSLELNSVVIKSQFLEMLKNPHHSQSVFHIRFAFYLHRFFR